MAIGNPITFFAARWHNKCFNDTNTNDTHLFFFFTKYNSYQHTIFTKLFLCKSWFIAKSAVDPSQSVFTCSKLTIETLEQGVKYVQIVNFEHVNSDWISTFFHKCLLFEETWLVSFWSEKPIWSLETVILWENIYGHTT